MKKQYIFILLLQLLIIILPCCKLFNNKQQVTFKIIETTDVHGKIFPYDFINDRKTNTSLAQVYSYVKKERLNKEQQVILLDNGDILQGQPVVYYYNFLAPREKHICSSIMNYMKYDAGSVGNHDIEPGHDVYDKLVKDFNFPWLSANSINAKTGEPYFKPYKIIRKKGFKIAVLGLTTPGIPDWLPEIIWQGIEFEDMIVSAGKWVKIIQEKEKPDLIIGLFHSGVDCTYSNKDCSEPGNPNASQLVGEHVEGFDIIFAGHDHKKWNKIIKSPLNNDVLLMGAEASCKNIAVADITFYYNKSKNKYEKKITGEIVDTGSFEADRDFLNKFSYAYETVKQFVSGEIGSISKTISTRQAMFGDSAFTDLIHTVQFDITGSDISFAAPLTFDSTIEKGVIYVRDMFKLYKYENLLYTMDLTGKQVKDYLEYSYGLWFATMKNEDSHIINFKLDENGNPVYLKDYNSYETADMYYNYDSAAGIIYTVDVSKEPGNRITIHSMSDGSAFDYEKTYKAAINSYRGNGGGGHLTRGAGIPGEELADHVTSSTIKDLRYYMIDWIEKKDEEVYPLVYGTWNVIPSEWYEKAVDKDYKMLFGEYP